MKIILEFDESTLKSIIELFSYTIYHMKLGKSLVEVDEVYQPVIELPTISSIPDDIKISDTESTSLVWFSVEIINDTLYFKLRSSDLLILIDKLKELGIKFNELFIPRIKLAKVSNIIDDDIHRINGYIRTCSRYHFDIKYRMKVINE